ncbi:MAG TPA: hypothetical protein VFJ68_06210 [Casimicrobiaceae bacterium]|nr:hypothetical protein [Casimicrobiaceae bacterium]
MDTIASYGDPLPGGLTCVKPPGADSEANEFMQARVQGPVDVMDANALQVRDVRLYAMPV